MKPRKTRLQIKEESLANDLSIHAVKWIGSLGSLAFHTVVFTLSFCLYFFGTRTSTILLALTTVVSLEAIYLAIFVQMTLNRHSDQLEVIKEDEDTDIIVEEKSIDAATLSKIEHSLHALGKEIAELKNKEAQKNKH